jgi:4-aminobutyrate aminotransferase-like enzyme
MTRVGLSSPAAPAGPGPADAAMIGERSLLLGPAYRLFYERPVHPVRGEGVWLTEDDGRRLLDAYNNVVSVGHCHPHVVDAIVRQLGTLNTHTRYLDRTILDYSRRLLATFPGEPRQIMYTCTGSEANDLALRAARHFTGRQGVIVTAHAYHGTTEAVAELSPSLGPAIAPGARIRTVPPPGQDPGSAARFAADVRAAIADLEASGHGVAAILFDTVFSSDGLLVAPPDAFDEAVAAVRGAGGVLIADEVQAGFGRTGAHMWGFLRYRLNPDIVTMGKPMGNGHPIAAAVFRPEVIAGFGASTRYFNTFGGNPVSCAAAAAVLDVIEAEDLLGNARAMGVRLREGMQTIGDAAPAVGAVRTAGLFAAADIVDANGDPDGAAAAAIVNRMREAGVLISATGRYGHTLKIRPPLVFEREHIDLLLEALSNAVAA